MNTNNKTFSEFLSKKHPGLVLSNAQQESVALILRATIFHSGKGAGKTFLIKLFREYDAWLTPSAYLPCVGDKFALEHYVNDIHRCQEMIKANKAETRAYSDAIALIGKSRRGYWIVIGGDSTYQQAISFCPFCGIPLL